MKYLKYWIMAGVVVFIAVVVMAQGGRSFLLINPHKSTSMFQTSITGDVSGAEMPVGFHGGVLYSMALKCTDDDTVTVAVKDSLGITLQSFAATSAIAGERIIVDEFYPVSDQLTYDISGYADSVACTLEVVLWVR